MLYAGMQQRQMTPVVHLEMEKEANTRGIKKEDWCRGSWTVMGKKNTVNSTQNYTLSYNAKCSLTTNTLVGCIEDLKQRRENGTTYHLMEDRMEASGKDDCKGAERQQQRKKEKISIEPSQIKSAEWDNTIHSIGLGRHVKL